jgi:hypothetical protein
MDLTINGRAVTVDDSFRNLSREEQDATVEEIAHSMPKPEGSGVVAGIQHGVTDLKRSNAETDHQLLGGAAPSPSDPNYVPANLTNGSINPLNWNWSQAPQKVAEMAPGVAQDVVAGGGAKLLSKLVTSNPKLAIAAGLIGGAASAWHRTAGDTIKETASARTGDAEAEPTSEDKLRGGLTAAAASVPAALPVTRLIPGSNKLTSVGATGALDAVKKYLGTAATGAVGSAGSDAITQLGTTGTVDPSRTIEAAAGGGLTSGVMAAPRGLGDTARAVSLREHGGDNLAATENYATRLQKAADKGLGNSGGDYVAHETVKSDIQNELRDAAKAVRSQKQLSPDADNALQRAQDGLPLTPADIALIDQHTAGAPDGANAAYLARTMRMAQLAQERGSYDSKGKWAGGLSGVMDKNLGFLLNPARLIGGTAATMLGMHVLGLGNPVFGAGIAGSYLGARGLDSVTGMRSPAKTFAEHFANDAAQLRMPQTPQAAPPPAPGMAPSASPWGPRPPLSGPTGPQVAPPAMPPAPTQPWSAPQISELWNGPNPIAAKMLAQKLKAGLPPEPTPEAPPAPEAPKAPWSTPKIAELWNGPNPIAAKMLKARLTEGLPQAEPQAAPAPAEPVTPSTEVPKEVFGASKKLVAALDNVKQMRDAEEASKAAAAAQVEKQKQAQAKAEAQKQTQAQRAQAAADKAKQLADNAALKAQQAKTKEEAKAQPARAKESQALAKEAAKAEQAKVKAAAAQVRATSKITKKAGKVESTAPEAAAEPAPYSPLDEHQLYPRDITPEAYAMREASEYGARSPGYLRKAEASARSRIEAETALVAKHPSEAAPIKGLVRQLHRIGSNATDRKAAVAHYASFMKPEAAADVLKAFH